jgi:hypothetical protein
MKVKLLKKLRRRGRNQINIHSVTTQTRGLTDKPRVSGMSIGYNDDIYCNLWDSGLTEEDVLKKAERIYIESYLNNNRS